VAKATRNLSEIRLSRLTSDPIPLRWFERNESDDAATSATGMAPRRSSDGAAAELEFA
jgi:hypothetical protein